MTDTRKTTYGPHNPHPLSQMRTELVWEGKYDEFGNRREVNVGGLTMPLQRIETIDEPRSRAQAQGSLFDEDQAHTDDFRNRLIWGDNKLVTASLLSEFKGAIDMIYIDPPFDVGSDFSIPVPIGETSEMVEKDPSILEAVAYRDTWGRGTNSYLSMLYERFVLMRELLKETGSIFVHVDWRMSHLVRVLLQDVFGRQNFISEIVWKHQIMGGAHGKKLPKAHENILWCAKSDKFRINTEGKYARVPFSDYVRNTMQQDENGRWFYTRRRMSRKASAEELASKAHTRTYVDDPERGTIASDVWDDMPSYQPKPIVNTKYPTQKPDEILERVISAATQDPPYDNLDSVPLVADFFCGSGTTGAVAERLGRRWIMSDLGRFGVHTARKRLIDIQRTLHEAGKPYRSFDIYNLGRYERQWWQQDALKGAEKEHRHIVLHFFRAEQLANAPSPVLHGRKGSAFVHVGGIDSIFTRGEAAEVAKAVKASGGGQVHCLAWDFEMDIRQAVSAIETELGVKIRLHRIPREIMEKNRTEVPPFFEIALLEVEPVIQSGKDGEIVDIKLTNFLPSLTEVPSKELEALKERAVQSGFDFIDFWAVDFDWSPGKPFNHHWQDYRIRKDRNLRTVSDAEYTYNKLGKHTACVKVVDVFGCDTSITVEIET